MSTLQARLHEVMGTENLELAPVEIIGAEDQGIVLIDNELAAGKVAISEHEKEITNLHHDINIVEDRVVDIEENISGLEAMMSGEAMWNPALAMKMYNDTCRLTNRNFGVSNSPTVIQGLESFQDVDLAKLEIVDGVEDFKKKLSSARVAIVEFFKNLYKSIIAVFVGMFDQLKGIERRADIIMNRLNQMTDNQLKQTIRLGSWNKYLNVDINGDVLITMAEVNQSLLIMGKRLTALSNVSILEKTDNITDYFKDTIKKKKQEMKDDRYIISGQVGTMDIEISLPKFFKQYRAPIVKLTFDDTATTSGEYKDNIFIPELKKIISTTKANAISARTGVININTLTKARDAALKAISGYDHGTDAVNKIKTVHTTAISVSKELTRYEGNVLLAAQKYVTAHF